MCGMHGLPMWATQALTCGFWPLFLAPQWWEVVKPQWPRQATALRPFRPPRLDCFGDWHEGCWRFGPDFQQMNFKTKILGRPKEGTVLRELQLHLYLQLSKTRSSRCLLWLIRRMSQNFCLPHLMRWMDGSRTTSTSWGPLLKKKKNQQLPS